jgi:hypothetical protein
VVPDSKPALVAAKTGALQRAPSSHKAAVGLNIFPPEPKIL